jgi:hypothetical protein
MPTITVPAETYERLARRAIEQAAAAPPDVPTVLTGEAWRQAFDALTREVQARADRYPPGFVLDDSRETMYFGREDEQP